jgi:two-component sensor histidine kinase/PAS domain-containing protein
MSLYGFVSIIATLLYLQAAFFTLFSRQKAILNLLFAAVCVAFAWFSGWVFVFQLQTDAPSLYQLDAFASFGWALFPVLLTVFFYFLVNISFPWIRRLIFFVLLPLAILTSVRYCLDPQSIKTFYQHNEIWFFRINLSSVWTFLFVGYLILCGIISFFLLLHWHDTLKTNKEELQFKIIFGSLGVSFIMSLVTNVVFPFVGQQMLPGMAHINFLPLIAGVFYALMSYSSRPFSPLVRDMMVIKYFDEFVFFFNMRGQLLEANQYALTKLGYNRHARIEDFFAATFRNNEVVEAFIRLSCEGRSESGKLEAVLFDKKGKEIPVELKSARMTDRLRRTTGIVLIGKDLRRMNHLRKKLSIHELRKQAQMREQEDLMKLLARTESEWQGIHEKLNDEMLEMERADQQMRGTLLQKRGFIQEIYHRVKNAVQIAIALTNMLGMNGKSAESNKQVLANIADSIRQMADVHDILYKHLDLPDSGLKHLIESTVSHYMIGLNQRKRPEVTMKLAIVEISIGQAIPLGVAFREMFTSALMPIAKQAKGSVLPTTVHIELMSQDNTLQLSVRDNNTASFDDRVNENEYQVKIRFVEMIAKEQLFGRLDIKEQGGVLLELTVPLQKK